MSNDRLLEYFQERDERHDRAMRGFILLLLVVAGGALVSMFVFANPWLSVGIVALALACWLLWVACRLTMRACRAVCQLKALPWICLAALIAASLWALFANCHEAVQLLCVAWVVLSLATAGKLRKRTPAGAIYSDSP